jgi:c(7)-type cytochrome triheme protein
MLMLSGNIFRSRSSRPWLVAALMMAGATLAADRLPLAKDGLHDPANPAIKLLQEPAEALAKLPPDVVGNRVRWVQALEQGLIAPRTNILPDTKIKVLDQDVIMPRTGEMPMVRFPHKQHTEWLDCSNCHEHLFKSKAGANKQVNMLQILQGEYCGLCHGAVSFPLTECKRCHSVERK